MSDSNKITGLDDLQKMVSLCKRRGFVFQSSEIYGGINACWDYGPLGVELKLNVKSAWWNAMTRRPDIEGLDAAILMHPIVWKAQVTLMDSLILWSTAKNVRLDFVPIKIRVAAEKIALIAVENSRALDNFNLMFKT